MSEKTTIDDTEGDSSDIQEIRDKKFTINALQIREKEFEEKIASSKKEYSKRETDLIVLNELVKEKSNDIEELRTEKQKLKKTVKQLNASIKKNKEEEKTTSKKLESLQAERKAVKNSIEIKKSEVSHANNLLEKKENEITVLNEQLQIQRTNISNLSEEIEDLEQKKSSLENEYEDLEVKFKLFKREINKKQDTIISMGSLIKELLGTFDNFSSQFLLKNNIMKYNEQVLDKFSGFIDNLNSEYEKKKKNIEEMNKKYKSIQTDVDNLTEFRDEISNLLGLNQKILEDLFNFEKSEEIPNKSNNGNNNKNNSK
ncbi:hypothetical protein DSAG12_02371 [Promethearchaeum syntrophicum]|uniref:Uncharacterized protein n=1 Tax=Promethearchaeum syntrophicum TaxID=2594042 RepID=A0A5B9DBX8_9ARCH|nr:hypothetical protein [Candidatus Prometheoarchaeum syntrophicum]QEE16541.1 Chromosome partition protein Smc [Candidatus Prometheoarchaeum syntrophicum]